MQSNLKLHHTNSFPSKKDRGFFYYVLPKSGMGLTTIFPLQVVQYCLQKEGSFVLRSTHPNESGFLL
uniref:Uncharacterized protein n=1 Tax=Lepeophtheirus salmonis TaxID=72036 RepID=A0A0K2U9S7_LEPSM